VLHTPAEVTADLHHSALVIERAATITRPVQAEDGQRHALDALVRARRVAVAAQPPTRRPSAMTP
jgi:hypothetical protein